MINFAYIKSFGQYHTNCKEESVENCCKGGVGEGKSPYQKKKIGLKTSEL